MSNSTARLPKWPFVLGDLLLVLAAGSVIHFSEAPLDFGRLALVIGAVALGAGFTIYPFVHEFRLASRISEAGALATATAQLGNLEHLMSQVQAATSRWHVVQEAADQTATKAAQISDRISTEVKGFNEFMQKANDNQLATLRLEADKLRRVEGEWLHAAVHMLDHVYALNQGAIRSGQPALIENIGAFQNTCREIVRRLGLVPFGAQPSELFDPHKHQLPEGDSAKAAGLPISDNLACGYTYQGRLLRPAVVRVTAVQPEKAQPEAEQPS